MSLTPLFSKPYDSKTLIALNEYVLIREMPHPRRRFITALILSKLKLHPVVALQGARQTGKSFLSREILAPSLSKSQALTFDQDSVRELAERDVESFLLRHSDAQPLILDEAQKVPRIFDGIKFMVDQKRIPGRYLILGSTEFSKMMSILESLTGRMGRARIYPMTLAEAQELEAPIQESKKGKRAPFYLSEKPRITKESLLKHLEAGGLPAIFSVRNASERRSLLQDWFELTVQRDIHTIPKLKLDSNLAARILKQLATLSDPTAPEVARTLRVDLRRIKRHIEALETLFVLQRVDPHPASTGQPNYFLVDCGLAAHLGANLQRQLETLFVQEYFAKRSFLAAPAPIESFSFYRSAQGRRVGFMQEVQTGEWALAQIFDHPPRKKTDFFALEGASQGVRKHLGPDTVVRQIAISPTLHVPNPKAVQVLLWESLG